MKHSCDQEGARGNQMVPPKERADAAEKRALEAEQKLQQTPPAPAPEPAPAPTPAPAPAPTPPQ